MKPDFQALINKAKDSLGAGLIAVSLTDIPRSYCFLGFPVETAKRGIAAI